MSHNKSEESNTEEGDGHKEVSCWVGTHCGLVEEPIEGFGHNGEEGLEDPNNTEHGTNFRRFNKFGETRAGCCGDVGIKSPKYVSNK